MEKPELIAALRAILPPEAVIDDPDALQPYRTDWIGVDVGDLDVAVLPADGEEVVEVVRLALAAGLPLVARGAGTGLAGGARPKRGGVVVGTARMQQVEGVDVANRRALVQPGLINYEFSEGLKPLGYFFAPDPASWKMCTLGGNFANNSGGPRCMKYGVTTNHVLALELAMHDGRLLWTGDGIQDSAGYDLTGLVIGSEGTFGLITRAMVKLTRLPEANRVVLALFHDIVTACEVVSAVLAAGLLPTALEVMDGTTMLAVNRAQNAGLPEEAGAALIIEVDGVEEGLDDMLAEITGICRQHGAIRLQAAASAEEQERLWSARRSAFASFHTIAPAYHLVDTVVPRTRLPAMMAHVKRLSAEYGLPIANVFHAGDGNLHPLVLYDPADAEQTHKAHAITAEVLKLSIAEGGTVSGEHGIGVEKQDYLATIFTEAELQAQAAVYAIFNPNDSLNPAKVFPKGHAPLALAAAHRARLAHADGRPETGDRSLQSPISNLQSLIVPQSLDELSEALRAAHAAGAIVTTSYSTDQAQSSIVKSASRRPYGQRQSASPEAPPEPVEGLVEGSISLAALNRVLHYNPDDLTISVEAGMTLAALQALLARHGQMLPLDGPLPETTTIGEVVANGWDGPRRLGYGLPRDMVLGLTVVQVDSTVLRFGGQVVKNVSGYDMVKLFVGSRNTLGVIAAVSLRVYPQPQTEATLLAQFPSRAA
ncbi:MAG: FAD-binding oxidoreductase, partial [Chloroflexaceae bacterium]|nr:FAD-binding oxidoreductase [Chloroflexaceae bacterium]